MLKYKACPTLPQGGPNIGLEVGISAEIGYMLQECVMVKFFGTIRNLTSVALLWLNFPSARCDMASVQKLFLHFWTWKSALWFENNLVPSYWIFKSQKTCSNSAKHLLDSLLLLWVQFWASWSTIWLVTCHSHLKVYSQYRVVKKTGLILRYIVLLCIFSDYYHNPVLNEQIGEEDYVTDKFTYADLKIATTWAKIFWITIQNSNFCVTILVYFITIYPCLSKCWSDRSDYLSSASINIFGFNNYKMRCWYWWVNKVQKS